MPEMEKKSMEGFITFLSEHSSTMIKTFAYIVHNSSPKPKYPKAQEVKRPLVENNRAAKEYLLTSYYGSSFFKWLIPDDQQFKDGISYRLKRPKSALGPYNYEEVLEFKNNTIVHGFCKGAIEHYFFAICYNEVITIFSTFSGRDELIIKRHKIDSANIYLSRLKNKSYK